MNRRSASILAVVLLLIGGTAGLLAYWKTNQKLGKPGVKVAQQPTYDWAGNVVATNSVYLPEKVLDYESSTGRVTKQELGMLPKDTTYGRRVYRAPDGFQISCSAILMGTDRTSIHKPEYCLPGQGWVINEGRKEQTQLRIDRPHPYRLPLMKWIVKEQIETAGGQRTEVRGVYVFWFVADGELTVSHLERLKWLSRDLLLTGVLQRWAYVSCFSICYPGQEETTYARMKEFIAAAVPEFQLTTGPAAIQTASFTAPSP